MATRMSRVGRGYEIFKVMSKHFNKHGSEGLTCGQLARKMGMKSSTYLKKVCEEAAIDYDQICIDKSTGTWRIHFNQYVQIPLLDRFIVINGHRYLGGELVTTYDEWMTTNA